ncbi:MAG: hypothetical protein H6740_18290 [Alphaproteobacteria bacterium]|nr:hypothetical protein [Alphaproteobacteria bacterium]
MILTLLCALPSAWATDPWAVEDEETEAAPSAWTAPPPAAAQTPAPAWSGSTQPGAWTPGATTWAPAAPPPSSWTPGASAPALSTPMPTPSSGAWAPSGGSSWSSPAPSPPPSAWTPSGAYEAPIPPSQGAGAWAPPPATNGWGTAPAAEPTTSPAWSLPDAPPSMHSAWSTPAAAAPQPVMAAPVAPAPAVVTATPGRACLSDLCARGDRLDVGRFDFDGVSAVADIQLGYTRAFVDGELGASRLVPVAGAQATWTTDTFSLDMPWSTQVLLSPALSWRDYNGDTVRSHGGALALNLGGLMSLGLGTGHHSQLPVIFRDTDQDGVVDEGELSRGSSRWTSYGFLVFTPVTFIRQVGPQLWG